MKFLDAGNRWLTRWSEEKFYLALLSIMSAVVAVTVMVFALGLHRNFMTIACDTAVIQSGLVNLMHGNGFVDNGPGGPSILGSHTTFLLLLLVPIYAMFPSADTLFVLQIIGVYSTAIPLYLVAMELLRRPLVAFVVAVSLLASPLLLHMAIAPVHLETWIGAAALWSYFFYLRNRLVGFCLSFLFAVCCGEQASLIYIALGVALLLIDDGLAWRKRFGMIALVGGFLWILTAVTVIGPLGRGGRTDFNIFSYNYTQWNIKSVSGLPLAVLDDPLKAVSYLLSPLRWMHVFAGISLPLVMALFSRRSFILLAPFPLYFLMCDQEFYLYFHAYYYQFALFAGYLGLLFFLARWEVSTRLGLGVLAATLFLNIMLLFPVAGFYTAYTLGSDEALTAALHDAFDKIPTDAAVYSPHRYSAYLSNRENMVIGDMRDENLDFKKMLDARFDSTNVHPEQIDYIVCDLINDQCGWRSGGYNPDNTKRRTANVEKLVQSGQWQLFWQNQGGDLFILHRIGK